MNAISMKKLEALSHPPFPQSSISSSPGHGFHARLFRSLPFDEAFRPYPQEYAMIEPSGSGHHQHHPGQDFHARLFRSLPAGSGHHEHQSGQGFRARRLPQSSI